MSVAIFAVMLNLHSGSNKPLVKVSSRQDSVISTALVKHFKVLQGPKASALALYSAVRYSSNQVLSAQQVLVDSSLKC